MCVPSWGLRIKKNFFFPLSHARDKTKNIFLHFFTWLKTYHLYYFYLKTQSCLFWCCDVYFYFANLCVCLFCHFLNYYTSVEIKETTYSLIWLKIQHVARKHMEKPRGLCELQADLVLLTRFKRRDLIINWKEGHGNVSDFCCLSLVFCHCLDLQMVNIGLRVLARPQATMLPDMYRKLGLDFDERVLPSIMNEVHSSCN